MMHPTAGWIDLLNVAGYCHEYRQGLRHGKIHPRHEVDYLKAANDYRKVKMYHTAAYMYGRFIAQQRARQAN